ncbi:Scramblase-domain-containing protein [Meira miltonrushii]|uniref:Scramblase-domain-containing protein n=1 Tax=Meira miltonrushii TaxID=1280837 RepID=A0A316VFN3_9BASI|nr:Scramblase-domain-containing protein [Meira miltonrushii]PWN35878.1 Scramblase-domain-containing protein [Meira miltonrushii]
MSIVRAGFRISKGTKLIIEHNLRRSSTVQPVNSPFLAGQRVAGCAHYSSRLPGSRPSRLAPRRVARVRSAPSQEHAEVDHRQPLPTAQEGGANTPSNSAGHNQGQAPQPSSSLADLSQGKSDTQLRNLPALTHSTVPVPLAKDGERGVIDQDAALRQSVESILGQPTLVVTREIEMLNVFLGYEQANKYSILTPEGYQVGYLAESEKGLLGGTLKRQFLRTHRSFEAHIMDTTGRVVLTIRRPTTLINSKIKVLVPHPSTGEERLVGEVHQIWHPYKRKYELFVNQGDQLSEDGSNESMVQFAGIDGGFLAWDFMLTDEHNRPLGAITRNFRGFGRELFTDTGQYILTFDPTQNQDMNNDGPLDSPRLSQSPQSSLPPPSSSEKEQSSLTETATGKELITSGPSRALTMDERAVALATAISADFDYFSRHSDHQTSMFPPFFMMGGGGGGGGEAPNPNTTQEPTTQNQDSSDVQAPPPAPGSDGDVGPAAGTGAGYDILTGERQNPTPTQQDGGGGTTPWWEEDTPASNQSDGDFGTGQEEVWNDSDPWQSDDGFGSGGGDGWGWTDWLPGGD